MGECVVGGVVVTWGGNESTTEGNNGMDGDCTTTILVDVATLIEHEVDDEDVVQAARKIPPFTVKLPYGNKYGFGGNRVDIGSGLR